MANAPSKGSGRRISNIMGLTRGVFNFPQKEAAQEVAPQRNYGTGELISPALKSRILRGEASPEQGRRQSKAPPLNAILNLAGTSYMRVGQERTENRRILQLMPEVGKAARLMVASIFSPNDLSRQEIKIRFDHEGIGADIQTRLSEAATKFFQNKLNLKTAAPKWVYQFGYETGSAVFAIIPTQNFDKLQNGNYIATEAFVKDVVDPIACESLFGFGDGPSFIKDTVDDATGLESYGFDVVSSVAADPNNPNKFSAEDTKLKQITRTMVEKFIGHEALSLTDNPSVLQLSDTADKKRSKRTKSKIAERFKAALHEPMAEISADVNLDESMNNPMLIRLPPESVTVIHTPGEPADHQGYLVLLDIMGNPINITTQQADDTEVGANYDKRKNDLFSQVHQAYGMGTASRTAVDRQTMEHIYSRVVSRHLEKRLGKAGFGRVEISNLDATMRCMFSRLLQEKRTRILFLPKELVTYMTFEIDEYGYGVSKLNSIKFALGMKMALQVARVLAAIKAAMDKRNITMNFDENNFEQPEAMIENMVQAYIQKNAMTFSTDPGFVQSQIQQKSFTVKATGIPGFNFEVTNEADTKTGASDFDSSMVEYLDKQIINGLDVPASTMNSLNDDEYARSVTTTNLFFAMEVAIHQDTTIRHVSDLLRKYALYSKDFQKEIYEILPSLGKKAKNSKSITDEGTIESEKGKETSLPDDCTLETLIESMLIALPKPNIAPSKAQFESMEAMTTAMSTMMNSILPDELAGPDDKLRSIVGLLRSNFIALNVKSYMENVGMSGLRVPEGGNFASQFADISALHKGLLSIHAMIDTQTQLTTPKDPMDPASAPVPGYG